MHAVLVIDNSRSMGVETAAGTLLDRAKSRVNQFIDALPPDSRITLIPLAGSVEPFPQDAFRSKDDARRALERIRLVDVAGSAAACVERERPMMDRPGGKKTLWFQSGRQAGRLPRPVRARATCRDSVPGISCAALRGGSASRPARDGLRGPRAPEQALSARRRPSGPPEGP